LPGGVPPPMPTGTIKAGVTPPATTRQRAVGFCWFPFGWRMKPRNCPLKVFQMVSVDGSPSVFSDQLHVFSTPSVQQRLIWVDFANNHVEPPDFPSACIDESLVKKTQDLIKTAVDLSSPTLKEPDFRWLPWIGFQGCECKRRQRLHVG